MIDYIPPTVVHEHIVAHAPWVTSEEACEAKRIWLQDYQAPNFSISDIDLTFDIETDKTTVSSKLYMKREGIHAKVLTLDGENLELVEIRVNDRILEKNDYIKMPGKLMILAAPEDETFLVEVKTIIYPDKNFRLQGLYASKGIYCTQCEPEGFRHITYSLDRSDVLSRYMTTIVADKARFPVLLSNGNLVDARDLPDGRHMAIWHDPFAKPTYLFALIAGDFSIVEDLFVTKSGRQVTLQIYVEKGDEFRASFALESLKKAMKWDEENFGLEYDLDNLKIVAIADFNQGAMENKGLLVFNSFQVLASPETTVDPLIQQIERVVAHEYFHNWSGNRVTIRDWFQLTLKEGLTSYREQEFSADMNSRPVVRIQDVSKLRKNQFTEDSSPHAHPVQPASYVKIDNFYTSTVYNKGAELYRMLRILLGEANFKKGMRIFFKENDGQAVTTEEYMKAMEKASGKDLTQFRNWFKQAGTPEVSVAMEYDAATMEVLLTVKQSCPPTPECAEKQPFHFPLSIGLINEKGRDLLPKDFFLVISKPKAQFRFKNIDSKPIPSLLRNFSAPVKIEYDYTPNELRYLFLYDSDLFNRWDAGRRLALLSMKRMLDEHESNAPFTFDPELVEAYRTILLDPALEPAFRAEALKLPSLIEVIELMPVVDVEAAFMVQSAFERHLAQELESDLINTESSHRQDTIGSRALRALCLDYLASLDDKHLPLVADQFDKATTMTDAVNALRLLCHKHTSEAYYAKKKFYEKWKKDSIVMNYWFSVQARSKRVAVINEVKKLERNAVFDKYNPNKIRSLYGAFMENLKAFHDKTGNGYQFIVDKIIEIDRYNSFMAADLAKGFKLYPRLKPDQQKIMRKELDRILENGCSENVTEVVTQILGSSNP